MSIAPTPTYTRCPECHGRAGFSVLCATCNPPPAVNMYGCLPCPKCGGEYRWPDQKGTIWCDDCGFTEPRPAEA